MGRTPARPPADGSTAVPGNPLRPRTRDSQEINRWAAPSSTNLPGGSPSPAKTSIKAAGSAGQQSPTSGSDVATGVAKRVATRAASKAAEKDPEKAREITDAAEAADTVMKGVRAYRGDVKAGAELVREAPQRIESLQRTIKRGLDKAPKLPIRMPTPPGSKRLGRKLLGGKSTSGPEKGGQSGFLGGRRDGEHQEDNGLLGRVLGLRSFQSEPPSEGGSTTTTKPDTLKKARMGLALVGLLLVIILIGVLGVGVTVPVVGGVDVDSSQCAALRPVGAPILPGGGGGGGIVAVPPGTVLTAGGIGLNTEQVGNATAIIQAGKDLGIPPRGWVIAQATAMQESNLFMYANRNVPESLSYPHTRVGQDHDSTGLFQQRQAWGPLNITMNPYESAKLFFTGGLGGQEGLLDKVGWETMDLAAAAQSVQVSAFPDEYRKWEDLASDLVLQLDATVTPNATAAAPGGAPGIAGSALNCTPGPVSLAACPSRTQGQPVEQGLQPDALLVLHCVSAQFPQVQTFFGMGGRPNNSDHPSGRAIDFMIPGDYRSPEGVALGDSIAEWVRLNAAGLGVKYLIWNVQYWDPGQANWTPYGHPNGSTDDNSLHRNHVHVSVYGDQATRQGVGVAPVAGAPGTTGWVLPIQPNSYRISSGFGPRSSPGGVGSTNHQGLDFAAPIGTPLYAGSAGVVSRAGPASGFGQLIVIDSVEPGVQLYYGHVSRIDVRVGQQVQAGQLVGAVGNEGQSTGPHLHLETRVQGIPQNPGPFLQQRGVLT